MSHFCCSDCYKLRIYLLSSPKPFNRAFRSTLRVYFIWLQLEFLVQFVYNWCNLANGCDSGWVPKCWTTIWQLFVNDKTTFSSLQFLLRHFSLTSFCFPFLLGSLCKRYCYSHSNDNGISWGPYSFNHVIECTIREKYNWWSANVIWCWKKNIGPWGIYCQKPFRVLHLKKKVKTNFAVYEQDY